MPRKGKIPRFWRARFPSATATFTSTIKALITGRRTAAFEQLLKDCFLRVEWQQRVIADC